MDEEWKNNKARFVHKVDILDANFCTTNPKEINLKDKIFLFT